MTRWPLLWLVTLLGLVAGVTEWLRHPGFSWLVLLLFPLTLGLLLLARRSGPLALALLVLLLALGTGATIQQRRLARIQNDWQRVREELVDRAFQSLAGQLATTRQRIEDAVDNATRANGRPLDQAFAGLAAALPGSGPESGLALLEKNGAPVAWAGRFRLPPEPDGDPLQVRTDPYHQVFEVRHRLDGGRVIVGQVLLSTAPVIPDGSRSLSRQFESREGVALEFFRPGEAPAGVEVFSYELPTTGGTQVLFSVRPVPPGQGDVQEAALRQGGLLVTALLLVSLALGTTLLPPGGIRLAVPASLLWLFFRSPAGHYLGLGEYFSSATYFRDLLGPFSHSAGILALTGGILTAVGIHLWRRRLPVTWYSAAIGVVLLVAAPYAMRELGRGITPPSSGVPITLWLAWEIALFLATAAPIVMAAALFRGTADPARPAGTIVPGVALAVVAAIAGLYVWGPRIGWAPWYTFLWLPALFMVIRPAPRASTVTAIAMVAGCAAALLTWGAVIEGRLNVARTDVGGLGAEPDPLALRLLELFGEEIRDSPPPAGPADLLAAWQASSLGHEGYPVQLALWNAGGSLLLEVPLDSLDVSPALLATLVRNLDSTTTSQSLQVVRTPGVHSILLRRVSRDTVLTAVIGPRTRLIAPGRLGRLIAGEAGTAPLYALSLTLPEPAAVVDSIRLRWQREGWHVVGHRQLNLPDGVRHVHADVDLRGPVPVLVRGALVVLLDLGLLALLWIGVEAVAGRRFRGLSWHRVRRSYQARLAVTLGLFFLVPAIGFAAWGVFRLRAEDDRSRDLVIAQSLRDAVTAAGAMGLEPDARVNELLTQLGRRVDVELGLYAGGELAGASAPVLYQLGLLPPLIPPQVFLAMTVDDRLQLATSHPLDVPSLRTGYRVLRPGPPDRILVLAAPQPVSDPELGEQQADLVLVLLLATLVGIGGSVIGAARASRFLARPVEDLRRSALALGKGHPAPPASDTPPAEFEEVFGAFARMAADVRSSQAALEEARRRTAAVLASVATGVVALDGQGRILVANRRAEELLGAALPEGTRLDRLLDPAWAPLLDSVSAATRKGGDDLARELDIGERRIGIQVTRADTDLTAVVVALNDLTDISRAERVLAWGEMARQVAHEIKNPLTPLRLGIQHLGRVYRDRRGEFDQVLEHTSGRILAEIDRLDTIARAFSRFGAPPESSAPLERMDLVATARDVVQLYSLGQDGTAVEWKGGQPAEVIARKDEVKEVLVNILENARNAGATRVQVEVNPGALVVSDDGPGIPPEQLPRVFEPRFSTTSSGSGLGLPIVRRLVESWGGTVTLESDAGKGTRVTVRFREAGT